MPSNFNDAKALKVRAHITFQDLTSGSGFSLPAITSEFMGLYKGPLQQQGAIRLTGAGTKDSIAIKALDGENDRAYLYLFMQGYTMDGPNNNYYVKVGLRSTHGTDSASGDWFATLPQNGVLFITISNMQNIDLESSHADYTPHVEYMLLQRDRG